MGIVSAKKSGERKDVVGQQKPRVVGDKKDNVKPAKEMKAKIKVAEGPKSEPIIQPQMEEFRPLMP
ncbi:hypothetical protein KIN20_006335 [Parelaphostrongylus tenuis]|uniref:Uncharacterized protein n=1 Tax=Parelaphostrongylus tenuis TaxID=148309 RepID=A0AAD5QJA2_PARTN|nr:hypothetical protein KIN20_006335 [Parelaphostrongylus tenuis]